jgi:hypothetical protein
VALGAAGADLRDNGEDEVLGGDARLQLSADLDRHRLERAQRQGLGGQDVLDLTGADAHADGAEGAVGGGVRVTTDDGHAGLAGAELGADGVDDALVGVAHGVQFHAEFGAVLPQCLDLRAGDLVLDLQQVAAVDADGGDVVVLGAQGEVRAPDGASRLAQTVEGLGAGHLMDEVEVDVDEVGFPVLPLLHDVVVPDFLGEGAWRGHRRRVLLLPVLLCHSVHGPSLLGADRVGRALPRGRVVIPGPP